jgi:hypothetical protein
VRHQHQLAGVAELHVLVRREHREFRIRSGVNVEIPARRQSVDVPHLGGGIAAAVCHLVSASIAGVAVRQLYQVRQLRGCIGQADGPFLEQR